MSNTQKPLVALAMPRHSDNIPSQQAERVFVRASNRCVVCPLVGQSSLLCRTFNGLWCVVLNEPRFDYFVMLHQDVVPVNEYWIDSLVDEIELCGADVLSVVLPIKSSEGTTSTAVEGGDPWNPRRLTMHEVFELPETFSSEDVHGQLLVNTGLWIARIGDWCKDIHFETRDRIVKDAEGRYMPQVQPEDWNMSRMLHEMGRKVCATRKIAAHHLGFSKPFSNERPWGTWLTDEMQLSEVA